MDTSRSAVGRAVLACSMAFLLGAATAVASDEAPPATRVEEPLPPPRQVDASRPAVVPIGLQELLGLTLQRNPRLAQAGFAIDAAQGRALQAGLYPNPVLNLTADELADRTGPAGIWTPLVSQEIVTGGKLKLSRAAALREVDQATLALQAQRYARFTAVRQAYYDLLTLQRRIEILDDLVKLARESVETTRKLLEAKQVAPLNLIQLEVELERFLAERDATRQEVPAAFRRLAAAVGVSALPQAPLAGTLEEELPGYELESARVFMLEVHPDLRAAKVGVKRAQLLLQRAQVEPIPNVTVGAGYTRQSQNRSNDWSVGVSLPIPVWNRNQGGIAAAQAQVGEAVAQVGRVENDLVERLAVAYGAYASSRQRAERYRVAILPKARETYQLSLKAFQGGQFEYLRVLEAQRSLAQANLEYNRALGEAWRAASEVAGLLLAEMDWPAAPACPPALPKP